MPQSWIKTPYRCLECKGQMLVHRSGKLYRCLDCDMRFPPESIESQAKEKVAFT